MAGWKALVCATALVALVCGVAAVIDKDEITSLPGRHYPTDKAQENRGWVGV